MISSTPARFTNSKTRVFTPFYLYILFKNAQNLFVFLTLSYFSGAGEFSLSFNKMHMFHLKNNRACKWARCRDLTVAPTAKEEGNGAVIWPDGWCDAWNFNSSCQIGKSARFEQDTPSLAWRALVLPLCKGRVFTGNSWNHLCGRPKDEPG